MERSYPFPKGDTSLLTLSRNDLSTSKKDDSEDTLVLMQMPASLSPADLKSARIIASPTQQACLVVEDKGCSYSLSRVETSNAYILVPPLASTDDRPRKKIKSDEKTLVPVPARLHQPGGSGASFLELKLKTLLLVDLNEQLKDHVFDPYDPSKSWSGRALSSLAVDVQSSEKEVLDGLRRMHALAITGSDGTATYGLLTEEALQEAKLAIIATLTECEEFQDYAGVGISMNQCVRAVMDRVPTSETCQYMAEIIQHTLRTLQSDPDARESDKIQLDVRQVAVCVAHRLFSKQSDPWKEDELLSQWQRDLPGVGDLYQVSKEMLSGVALLTEKGEYKYFSEEKLPTDLEKRFDILFREKEKWTSDELKPYVQRLATGKLSETDLLLRYTRFVTAEVNGVVTKFVVKR